LGHLIAAKVSHHLEEQVAGEPFFMSEVAGRYLQEVVFGPGARTNWEYAVLGVAGERLNPTYIAQSLA
jgi:hypothetical protein